MHVDLTVFSEAMALVVLYYLLLYFVGARGVRTPRYLHSKPPLIVIIIPARNEELVIERSLRSVLATHYRGKFRVIVIDDGSSDRTAQCAQAIAAGDNRVCVLRRSPDIAGTGKSDVLNHAYSALLHWHEQNHPWLDGYQPYRIVLCILDADGELSPTALDDAASFFSFRRVGAVQIGVRIRNAGSSLLARLQDIEFIGFSYMAQTARDRFGSVGLGGNGQFTRMSALASLGPAPWSSAALTEDLDLGLRLMAAGWRLRFCSTAWVDQLGLTNLRPLMRQRTRWAQGHYQCWRHIPMLLGSRRVYVANRLDTLAYLGLITMVMIAVGAWVIRILGALDLVNLTNTFLAWLGDGFAYRVTVFVLSWLPIWLTMATYQRHAAQPLRWWEWPTYCALFAAYVYLWALATVRAWVRAALGRRNWIKTPRFDAYAGHAHRAALQGSSNGIR